MLIYSRLSRSGLPPQEDPVMIADKRELFFSFLSKAKPFQPP